MEYVTRTPDQLGTVLKSVRKQKRIAQSTVDSKVGLKQKTVSLIETDASRTSIGSLYKLLSALDMELVVRDRNKPSASAKDW